MNTKDIAKRIVENALIYPHVDSITIQGSTYDLYRTMQAMADPEHYVNNTTVGTSGVMLFNDEQEKQKAISVLKKMHMPFSEKPLNNAKPEPEGNSTSPYPGNGKKKNKK